MVTALHLQQVAWWNDWMPVWNRILGCMSTISKLIGYSGFSCLNLPWIMEYPSQPSTHCSVQFRAMGLGCHTHENWWKNETNDIWKLIKFRRQWSMSMSNSSKNNGKPGSAWGGSKSKTHSWTTIPGGLSGMAGCLANSNCKIYWKVWQATIGASYSSSPTDSVCRWVGVTCINTDRQGTPCSAFWFGGQWPPSRVESH